MSESDSFMNLCPNARPMSLISGRLFSYKCIRPTSLVDESLTLGTTYKGEVNCGTDKVIKGRAPIETHSATHVESFRLGPVLDLSEFRLFRILDIRTSLSFRVLKASKGYCIPRPSPRQ